MPARVALLLVSHSRMLAEAVEQLARQMTGPDLPIAIAAGAGPDGADLGTDATAIAAALERLVGSGSDVLVLMDLGSAVLSADLACDLVGPDVAAHVRLSAAPLVEGAVAAAVSAAAGAGLEAVAAEAEAALVPKRHQLGGLPAPVPVAADGAAAAEVMVETEVADPAGLHLRSAARIVACAADFEARVRLTSMATGAVSASAASVTALTGLGVRVGERVRVSAAGRDAAASVAAIVAILRAVPEPSLGTDVPLAPVVPGRAIPVVPGIAIGPLWRLSSALPSIPQTTAADPAAEAMRLRQAIDMAVAGIEPGADGILLAHCALLHDPALLDSALALVTGQRRSAPAAWATVIADAARGYERLDDPVLRLRAVDVRDAGARVLRVLLGEPGPVLPDGPPAVLLADDLPPSLAAQLDPVTVLGIIDRRGGPASHAAILLRGAEIPAVMGAAALVPETGGTIAALDGSTGEVWIDPDEVTLVQLRQRQTEATAATPARLDGGGVTLADGSRIELWANVGTQREADAALRAGAGGIGLLRTEMLFLDRVVPPDEDEQMAAVATLIGPFRGRPVVVRTLDAGADKRLPWLGLAPETNPYLGVRGLRLSLARMALFETQLRALLRAGDGHDLRLMLPMVTAADEVMAARAALARAHEALLDAGRAHPWPVPLGVMVEVPAAALEAASLAEVADFFSIGTNDLTQYVLAAERGHPALRRFADPTHPAVLRLCREVVEVGRAHDRSVSVCGEAAGDPAVAPLLVGLGVRCLSMAPPAIASVARSLRALKGE